MNKVFAVGVGPGSPKYVTDIVKEAISQCDVVIGYGYTIKTIEQQIKKEIEPFSDVPIVFISSLTKQRIFKSLELSIDTYKTRSKKIKTSKLNNDLLPIIESTPPPSVKGKRIKIKYTQT